MEASVPQVESDFSGLSRGVRHDPNRKISPGKPRRRSAGNQMISSIEIKNFRCFKSVKISDCRRINIIVGENGGGKTALLEAMFLTSGASPEVVLRLRQWRGFEGAGAISNQTQLENALWRDLFNNFDRRNPIKIILGGTGNHIRTLTISASKAQVAIPLDSKSSENALVTRAPVSFHWKGPGSDVYETIPQVNNGGITMANVPELRGHAFFFAANSAYSASETSGRFSDLSRRYLTDDLVDSFKEAFPEIVDLSIELVAGLPMIHASLLGFSEKVPLGLLSGGINKLASILTGIASQSNCLILADEIENGFHYSKLKFIWKMLLNLAKKTGGQIFLSTHSAEFLQIASEFAADDPEDFSVIHANDGVLRQFSGKKFAEAIDQNFEIR